MHRCPDGELAGCRVSNVLTLDGAEPRLRIARTYRSQARPRPDGTRGWGELGPTKNEYRERAIPLNAGAQSALRDWLASGWEHRGRRLELREQLMGQAANSVNSGEVPEELFHAFDLARRSPIRVPLLSFLEPTSGFEPETAALRKQTSSRARRNRTENRGKNRAHPPSRQTSSRR